MTGGEAFLLDADRRLLNDELVELVELDRADAERLLALVERHRDLTGSARAAALLRDPVAALGRFSRLVPRATEVELTAREGRATA
jgi:glutamate synthase (NADPH/NADH) large chain